MKQEVVFKQTALPPLEKDKKRKRRILNAVFNGIIVVLMVVLSLTIGYVGQIVYNNTNYSSFFVNGMSMYPTINRSAYAISDGKRVELAWDSGNFDNSGYTYRCETGLYDKSAGFIDRIERFSIVCTYYPSDYDSSGALHSGAAAKIKRVVALPGEWLYYESNNLYISSDKGANWQHIEETFMEPQSWWTEKEENWHNSLNVNFRSKNNPYTLGDDQYFVCGDNRRKSSDSRAVGAISANMIDGLVVLLNGEVNYYFDGNNWVTHSGVFDYYLPWKYRYI